MCSEGRQLLWSHAARGRDRGEERLVGSGGQGDREGEGGGVEGEGGGYRGGVKGERGGGEAGEAGVSGEGRAIWLQGRVGGGAHEEDRASVRICIVHPLVISFPLHFTAGRREGERDR